MEPYYYVGVTNCSCHDIFRKRDSINHSAFLLGGSYSRTAPCTMTLVTVRMYDRAHLRGPGIPLDFHLPFMLCRYYCKLNMRGNRHDRCGTF